MKRRRTKISILLISLITLAVVACNPEDGDTGPVGPVGSQGATGPKGDTGPAGQDGQDGQDGNANVQAYVFSVDSADWTQIPNPTRGGRAVIQEILAVSQVTQEVFDQGTVQVFISRDNQTNWIAMPFSDADLNYSYRYRVGEIELWTDVDDQGFVPFGYDAEFKVVVIPPSSLVKNMDYKDMEMLQAVYGI